MPTIKEALHYCVFFGFLGAVSCAPLSWHRSYNVYLLPMGACVMWLTLDGCPMNERQPDGTRRSDIDVLWGGVFGANVRTAKLITWTLIVGSLTIVVARLVHVTRNQISKN